MTKQRGVPGLPGPPTCPTTPGTPNPLALGRTTPTFAMRDVGGPIKVGAGVAWTGDAMVLAKLGLVGADRAADAAVGGGVVVMPWGAVHCRGGLRWWERAGQGTFAPGPPCPRGLSVEFKALPHCPGPPTTHAQSLNRLMPLFPGPVHTVQGTLWTSGV